MSPEAQRIAIAEACGYFPMGKLPEGVVYWGRRTDPEKPHAANKFKLDGLPDYLNDLNAIHEAEKVLNHHMREKQYAINLGNSGLNPSSDWESRASSIFYKAHATAAQRAEAFLRTIGKWEDSA